MSNTAINPNRHEDFSEWYQQIIIESDLAENSPVRGCMTIKPYGYAIWENIQKLFDVKLKKRNVQNAYFPLLIPLEFLEKEADHIDGFAKECAVVTHHRLVKNKDNKLIPEGELASPYIIRPTSEAIIGHSVAKWVKSYRDLPMKLNQWCNVMRWEMRPRMFLRSSEFLWQEGHTIFETAEEAIKDAQEMQEEYYNFINNELCLNAVKGEKTPEEKFPGALNTYTIEVMTQDGKALQAGTSHYLGQTFSKAFDIKFLGKDGLDSLAYTASWGISTRLIGALIMVHGDDNGLMLPPAIAPYQVIIIPINKLDSTVENTEYCHDIEKKLYILGITSYIDNSDFTSSNKTWKWVKKGAPLIIVIGNKERNDKTLTILRRDKERNDKIIISLTDIDKILEILKDYERNLRSRALNLNKSKTREVINTEELDKLFLEDFRGFALMNLEETENETYKKIAIAHSLTRRCVLEEDNDAYKRVIIAKSY